MNNTENNPLGYKKESTLLIGFAIPCIISMLFTLNAPIAYPSFIDFSNISFVVTNAILIPPNIFIVNSFLFFINNLFFNAIFYTFLQKLILLSL